jgi:hypothetical protein
MSEKVKFEGRKVWGPSASRYHSEAWYWIRRCLAYLFVQTLDIFAIIKNRYLVDFSDEESSFLKKNQIE